MPRIGLGASLASLAVTIVAAVKQFWENELGYWEASGNVWEQET
jgi:hypothetical protein|tara:strand:+ start:1589 stop:1720 length:132 start_codon:yes stop_codon:yes gene_type:complete